jgi:oligopeptide/dipeptide ABC transporter ATP-binding protein
MIELKNLYVSYFSGSVLGWNAKEIKAVEDVSFSIKSSETVGLVGESGCGKSTLGKAMLGLLPIASGELIFEGQNLNGIKKSEWLPLRKSIQVIFQDPYSSLNPRMTIFEIISEGVEIHFPEFSKVEIIDKVKEMLTKVNLSVDILDRYPHEFSGGQRQRIAIARALILNPKLIICDEAVSALDVSTQAQVMNLLKTLKKDFNLSYLFISHDLNIVKYISDKIAVMYLGKIVEFGKRDQITNKPSHPYTKALFASSYDLKNRNRERPTLIGEIPSVINKPEACYFHTRCPIAKEICRTKKPEKVNLHEDHFTYCHFPEK